MKSLHARSIAFVVGLAGGLVSTAPPVWADDCELATAAAIAQAKVPHAVTHVTSIPGESVNRVEMIFTADRAYLQTHGAWRSMAYSPQAQIDTINRKRAEDVKQTCEKPGSETINGEASTVLVIHTDANGKTSEARIWISEKTGLLLKSEVHVDKGSEVAIVTDNFRYDKIEAPAGVK